MKTEVIQETAFKIIMEFPKSNNGHPYLVMKNKRKLFFNRFIKKYGLDGTKNQYQNSDINRRLKLVEFFKFFTQECELKPAREKNRFLFESHFHRMVIINTKVGDRKRYANKMELLSFYPL
jgi:hypothetical protein